MELVVSWKKRRYRWGLRKLFEWRHWFHLDSQRHAKEEKVACLDRSPGPRLIERKQWKFGESSFESKPKSRQGGTPDRVFLSQMEKDHWSSPKLVILSFRLPRNLAGFICSWEEGEFLGFFSCKRQNWVQHKVNKKNKFKAKVLQCKPHHDSHRC